MFKKILAVALAVVMVMAMAAVAVSAAEVDNSVGADSSDAATSSGVIYFNPTGWNNVNQIYCHIWENGGNDFYGWKDKNEMCTKVGSMWSYDLSKLNSSSMNPGGMKSGKDYCVIFFADTGVQTYDLTIGLECVGDMAKLNPSKMIENPVDSQKKGYECVWNKNSGKYGPHKAISSVGNILGSKLCPNESGAQVIGDWLMNYTGSLFCDPVEVLTDVLPQFGVKDIEAVYGYILSNEANWSAAAVATTMKKQLEDAFAKAYPSEEPSTIDPTKADDIKDQIDNGANLGDVTQDPGEGSTGVGGGSGDSSNVGKDGQNDTILFVLAGIMLLAAGAFVATRKRTEV